MTTFILHPVFRFAWAQIELMSGLATFIKGSGK